MTPQRYTVPGAKAYANDHGQWVKFRDHEKAMRALVPLPPMPPQHDMTDSIDVDQGSEP
jgi:hypothetical protein